MVKVAKSQDKEILDFVRSLGIDVNKVNKVVITIEADSFVTIETTGILTTSEVGALKEVTKKYRLEEINKK